MNLFVFVVLGIGIGVGFSWLVWGRKVSDEKREAVRVAREKEEQEQIASGLEEFNREIQKLKEERKQAILQELQKQKEIQANDVADLFEVSKVTAFRYLEELEQEGKIRQVGKTGRGVSYQLL